MPALFLFAIAVTAVCVILYFFFEVMMFRLSCRLARVPVPVPLRVISVVFITIFIGLITASILAGAIDSVYNLGGFPVWEAGVVGIFLELPVHMLLVSAIHARMLRIPMRDALAVWFVEKLIKLLMISLALIFLALLIVVAKWIA